MLTNQVTYVTVIGLDIRQAEIYEEEVEWMEDIKNAFAAFKAAYVEARSDPTKKKEAGKLLKLAIQISGKSEADVVTVGHIGDRTSLMRWLKGENMPQPAQIKLLEDLLVPRGVEHQALAISLLEPRYWPVIEFMLSREAHGQNLTQDQLVELLDLAIKRKKTMTPEMMAIFLGLE